MWYFRNLTHLSCAKTRPKRIQWLRFVSTPTLNISVGIFSGELDTCSWHVNLAAISWGNWKDCSFTSFHTAAFEISVQFFLSSWTLCLSIYKELMTQWLKTLYASTHKIFIDSPQATVIARRPHCTQLNCINFRIGLNLAIASLLDVGKGSSFSW